jgi:triphosphoribosyl-dephospho-CoA synthase CitG
MITKLAYEALIKEVELTPKPGLVDKENNGSHKDMDLQTFYASAQAIEPFIQKFFTCKSDFESLRKEGLACEKAMFEATKGVNTHKGMIFSLAVFCGAIGSVGSEDLKLLQEEIKRICQDLIVKDLSNLKIPHTNGEKFFQKTKSAGIRAEAQAGYPTVFDKALPFYENELSIVNEEMALKKTLVFLMSFVPDTTLYARGGLEGLEFVQNEAKKLLHVRNLDEHLKVLDIKMIERNLSSGGCADLLGLTWFVSNLAKKR